MSVAPPEAPVMPMSSLPCIINWDDRMARAEEDLANAVTVTVCGAEPLAPVYEVVEVLAARLGVEASSLVLRQASNSSYLLVLPDIGFVQRLLDHRQPPLRSPSCVSDGVGWPVPRGGCYHGCSMLSFGEFRHMFGKPQLWRSS
jgi:hypothetical protein